MVIWNRRGAPSLATGVPGERFSLAGVGEAKVGQGARLTAKSWRLEALPLNAER